MYIFPPRDKLVRYISLYFPPRDGLVRCCGVFGLFPAKGRGDDIVLYSDAQCTQPKEVLYGLRQQVRILDSRSKAPRQ